jgi:hypothetical protein
MPMSAATLEGAGQDDTATGKFIIIGASALSAILVLLGIVYAAGAGPRHVAAMLAADCEPALFISGLPCTTQPMVLSQYNAIVPPAGKQLSADTIAYAANDHNSLVAAEAALTAEVGTVQALDKNLAAVTFTPANRATSLSLVTNADSTGQSFPNAAILFTPPMTVIAGKLIQADQALAALTAKQARSTTFAKMRSLDHQVQVASATVKTDMKLLLNAAELPVAAGLS